MKFQFLTTPSDVPVSDALLQTHFSMLGVDGDTHVETYPYIDAAAGEIEAQAEIAILARTVRAEMETPVPLGCPLPLMGPVLDGTVASLTLILPDGSQEAISASLHWIASGPKPELRILDNGLAPAALMEPDSLLWVDYLAGFGANVDSVPRDLQMAIVDQALRLYERRGDEDHKTAALTPSAARTVARYRRLRA
ncbi:hypothetical protein [Poseidonocella sp. HB161398]|uniref:head-tail connector protein n=1 Tax=Poseidonocella sp. HB161398 TaxID=2320855 RepID=UPI001109FB07|nr:hypothetical protein [Poseidonocella sp. HB161398]